MNHFEKTLDRIDNFCVKHSIEYVVIGGLAVITHGYIRTTRDIDITVLCQLENMSKIHDLFSAEFEPIKENSLDFFQKNFVIPSIDKLTRIRVDIAAGLTIFDSQVIKRRIRKRIGNAEFFVCSIEDLIIYKLFATRLQDLADVEEIIKINSEKIDKEYLMKSAKDFRELDRSDIEENLLKFLV